MMASTWAFESITVANNTQTQYSVFPGHGRFQQEDLISAHCYLQASPDINDNVIGPMDFSSSVATCCMVANGLALGAAQNSSATMGPVYYDLPLPFTASADEDAETRWRLASYGMLVLNTTVTLDKGGQVISVQPSEDFSSTSMGDFTRFPTFKLWGVDPQVHCGECYLIRKEHIPIGADQKCCKGCSGDLTWITWIPRPRDLAFNHLVTGAAQTNISECLNVWLQADATKSQKYQILQIWNWELAGFKLAALTKEAIDHPDQIPVINALKTARNSAPTASPVSNLVTLQKAATDTRFNELAHKAAGIAKTVGKDALEIGGALGVGALALATLPESVGVTAMAGLGEYAMPLLEDAPLPGGM
jgi:hypothetical protein